MLNIRLTGDDVLKRQIRALMLPPAKRKRIHRAVGRKVISTARQNISQQKTLDGSPMKRRQRDGKKALQKIAKGKRLKAYVGPNKVTVTWPNNLTGKIARAQQEGVSETVTARSMVKRERRFGEQNYSDPATKEQARALIKAGYKRPTGRKYKSGAKKGRAKTRRVSAQWIENNMKFGQAGVLLRQLENNRPKQSWQIKTPPRPFFGMSRQQVVTLSDQLMNDILNDIKRAR